MGASKTGSLWSESFAKASNVEMVEEDEEELWWTTLSYLPQQKRINYALLRALCSKSLRQSSLAMAAESPPHSASNEESIDMQKLSRQHCELVVKKALATKEHDNDRLLSAIKERVDSFPINTND